MKPQDVNLHTVDTSKGPWGIFVQSVVEAVNGDHVFITMILERNLGDERIQSRSLKMSVLESELTSPSGRIDVLNAIREWIESAEGDGAINASGS